MVSEPHKGFRVRKGGLPPLPVSSISEIRRKSGGKPTFLTLKLLGCADVA